MQTSLCTINLVEINPRGGDWLRMYGVDWGTAFPNTQSSLGDFVTFLDAYPVGSTTQRFVLEQSPAGNERRLLATGIPSKKTCQPWYYTIVYYGTSAPTGPYDPSDIVQVSASVWHINNQLGCMDVWYKDPSVVHLPEGMGWLMILTRARWVRSGVCEQGGGGECGATDGPVLSGPDDCLSDIVGYWAEDDDPGFTGSGASGPVSGPFWLVKNTEALGPGTDGTRLWLSVPGGAMVSPHTLAVYFVAEATKYAGGVQDPDGARREVFESIAWADRSGASRFESAIGVHLIDLDELVRMRALYWTFMVPNDESGWARTNDAWEHALRYDLASTIYVWRRDGDEPVEELLNWPSAATVKLVDPQCARCSNDPLTIGVPRLVRLFFATNGWSATGDPSEWVRTASNHHGLWMARALDNWEFEGRPRRGPPSLPPGTVAGVDFLVMSNRPFVEVDFSPADYDYLKPVDPDPVRLTDGSWQVGFGVLYPREANDPNGPGESSEALSEVTSDDTTVCSDGASWGIALPGPQYGGGLGRRVDWSPA